MLHTCFYPDEISQPTSSRKSSSYFRGGGSSPIYDTFQAVTKMSSTCPPNAPFCSTWLNICKSNSSKNEILMKHETVLTSQFRLVMVSVMGPGIVLVMNSDMESVKGPIMASVMGSVMRSVMVLVMGLVIWSVMQSVMGLVMSCSCSLLSVTTSSKCRYRGARAAKNTPNSCHSWMGCQKGKANAGRAFKNGKTCHPSFLIKYILLTLVSKLHFAIATLSPTEMRRDKRHLNAAFQVILS